MVAPTEERAAVRGAEQGVDLHVAQERDDLAIEALGRDGEHPLDHPGVLGMAQGGEAEEGVDRLPAGRCGSVRVLPRPCSRWSKNAEIVAASRSSSASVAGAFLVFSFEEAEQEPEGVPIGGDGVGARLALGHQPLGEERLEGGGRARSSPWLRGVLETLGGQAEQLGRGRQVPVGVGRMDVAQVGRELREPGLDVEAVSIPADQGSHGETVSEVMWPGPARRPNAPRCRPRRTSSLKAQVEVVSSGPGSQPPRRRTPAWPTSGHSRSRRFA